MALFVVPRFGGDGEEGPAGQAQLLLQQLQERARARQRRQQEEASCGLSSEQAAEPEVAGKRRRPSGGEGLGKKRRRRRQSSAEEDEEESLAEAGGSLAPEDEGHAAAPRGRTEAESGSNIASNLDSRGPVAAVGENCSETGVQESQGRPEQVALGLPLDPEQTRPPSSMIVLGCCDRKAVQKVQPLLPQWLAEPTPVQRLIKENLIPFQAVPEIHPKLAKKLEANGIELFFPVQGEVIPAILESVSSGFLAGRGGYQPSDLCVSAPTGSGKTLAFVIPVVQALLERVVCQVRALAVLPTKELAQQVAKVFNVYADGTGLQVVQLTGQKSFVKEQESLAEKTLMGWRSLADIVVATPGRLADHLQQSPQFSLKQLRFLIIDEADRMIDCMHQDWLQQVLKAVYRAEEGSHPTSLFRRAEQEPITAARACCPQIPLQKLLFSATLTRNPEKLQQLALYRPRFFTSLAFEGQPDAAEAPQAGQKKFSLPEGLSHYYVPCSSRSKPLFLLHFLLQLKFTRVLCFANSRETSHRLFLLVQAFGGVTVAEFSSSLSPSKRKQTLKEFGQGKIQLLISTDATARGIDIGGVKCVISYDAPQFIRTYIHRVGRTARAGKAGLAFTMLLKQQEHRFLRMLKEAGLPELECQLVKSNHVQPLLPQYEEALAGLQNAVKEERAQKRS